MKSISLVICATAALAGCSVNGTAPATAWGKKDVSLLDYRTDGGQCAVLAATSNPTGNASNTAGGIDGANAGAPHESNADSGNTAAGNPGGPAGPAAASTAQSISGGTYEGMASTDFAQRAAMQQRTQEMAHQRARHEALKSCLLSRGYTEFALTPDQRAQLDKLPAGSDARRDYLYKLGTDPEVLSKQAVRQPPPAAAK